MFYFPVIFLYGVIPDLFSFFFFCISLIMKDGPGIISNVSLAFFSVERYIHIYIYDTKNLGSECVSLLVV